MEKSLLSIDWDYFISIDKSNWCSCIENQRTILDLWYKRYIEEKEKGKNIQKSFRLSSEVGDFWSRIKQLFQFQKDIKVYVSDSHTLSYEIAKENGCEKVYLFDAHADLGYGGLPSLDFEVNCANWLGKLLKNKFIKEANIIYSPFTKEKISDFNFMNHIFNIHYPLVEDLNREIPISTIHICRSGAWTPPWFDEQFIKFVEALGRPYKKVNCSTRTWNVEHMNLSDKIHYRMI